MFKNLLKLNALVALLVIVTFTSCSKEESANVDVENYVTEATYELQKSHRIGRPGCFKLIFPVTVELPDGTTAEADSYANIKEVIRAWKESNPEVDGRPSLQFPIEVMTEDGEVVSVADKSELIELKKDCRANFDGPRDHHFRACFNLVYPLTIAFPDGTTAEAANRIEIKQLVREWKANNPVAAERPTLQYPIEIVYEDGTTEIINSKEELIAAKQACRD